MTRIHMQPITFRNRKALFLWGFAAIWWLIILYITGLLLTHGLAQQGYSLLFVLVILAAFWLAAFSLVGLVNKYPCYWVKVIPRQGVEITWRYPFKTVYRQVSARQMNKPEIIESTDSDGDAYFIASMSVEGMPIRLYEGIDRQACQQVCEQFESALQYDCR